MVMKDEEPNGVVHQTNMSRIKECIDRSAHVHDTNNQPKGDTPELESKRLNQQGMPRMNGMDATMKLRELGFSKPIVAVTANATLQDRHKCIAAGMHDVLPKPFSKKQILDILGRCCTAKVCQKVSYTD
jgi:DNA-binding NarL/FixJ family response regulator